MTTLTDRQPAGSNLFRYSILALPLAFAGLPIYMLAPDFYATDLQVSLASLGFGLLILRLIDAFLDLVVGRLLDIFLVSARLIAFGAIGLLGIGFFALFVPPELSGNYAAGWFFGAVFVVTLAFSTLTILYGMTGAVWSADEIEQTKITTSREGVSLVGLILAISIPFMLMEFLAVNTAYLLLVVVFLSMLLPISLIYVPTQTKILGHASEGLIDVSEISKPTASKPLTSRNIRFLYGCYAVSAIASAIPAVLVVFFVRDYLGSQTFIGLALMLYFLAGALSMPVWQRIATRVGKIRAWQLSMALAIVSFTWVLFLSPGDFYFYVLICLTSGFALGAEMALPPSILAENLGSERGKSAALKYSGLSLISKLALSIAVGASLPILGFVGFEAGKTNDAYSLSVLLLLYGALPGLLKLFALVLTQTWIYIERKETVNAKRFSTIGGLSDV